MAEAVSVKPKTSAMSDKSGEGLPKCVFKNNPYKKICHRLLTNHSIDAGKIYKNVLKKHFEWMMDILLNRGGAALTLRQINSLLLLFNDILKHLYELVNKRLTKISSRDEFESIFTLDLRPKKGENLVYLTLLALLFMMACVYYHKKRYVASMTYSRLAKRLLISSIFPKIDPLLTKWSSYFEYIHSIFTLYSARQFYVLNHESTCECIAEMDEIYELYGRKIEELTGENPSTATAETDFKDPLWLTSDYKPEPETKNSFLSEKEDSEKFKNDKIPKHYKAYGTNRSRRDQSALIGGLEGLEISDENRYSFGDTDSSVYVDSSDEEEEKDFTRRCDSNTQRTLFDVDKIVLDYRNWNIVEKDCRLFGRHAWMVVLISRRVLSCLVEFGFHQPQEEKGNLMRVSKALLECLLNYPNDASNDIARMMMQRETINAHSLLMGSFDISTKSMDRKYFKELQNDIFCDEEDLACQQIKFSHSYSELVRRNYKEDSLAGEQECVRTKPEGRADLLKELEGFSKSKPPNKFRMFDLITEMHHKSFSASEDDDFSTKVKGIFENWLKQNIEAMKILVIYTIDFCLEHTEEFTKHTKVSRDLIQDQNDRIMNAIVKLADLLNIYGKSLNPTGHSKSSRKNSKSKGSSFKPPHTIAVEWDRPLVLTNELSSDVTSRATRSSQFGTEYYTCFEELENLHCYSHSITDNLRSDLSTLHGVPDDEVYQNLIPALMSVMDARIRIAKIPYKSTRSRSSSSPLFQDDLVVKARGYLEKKAIKDDQYKSLDKDWKKLADCLGEVSRLLHASQES